LRKTLVLAATVLCVIAGTVVAAAAIPDANGVIHACRKNNGGTLRVIDTDAGQTCASNETALNWSQTGPQGPPGAGGISGLHVVSQNFTAPPNNPGFTVNATVPCPTGEIAVSGGFILSSTQSLVVDASRPSSTTGWNVIVNTISADSGIFTVYATCASGS
jgi:hypothetical protein